MKDLRDPPLHGNLGNSAEKGRRPWPWRREIPIAVWTQPRSLRSRGPCISRSGAAPSNSQQVFWAPSQAYSKACAFSKNTAGRHAPSDTRPCHKAAGTKTVSRGRRWARRRMGQGRRQRNRPQTGTGVRGRSSPAGRAARAAFSPDGAGRFAYRKRTRGILTPPMPKPRATRGNQFQVIASGPVTQRPEAGPQSFLNKACGDIFMTLRQAGKAV